MSKLIKIIATLVALTIAAFAALIVLLDPNDYKQELQNFAAKQGVTLHIKGDLSWQLWPSLGIQAGEVSISPRIPALAEKGAQNKMAQRPLAQIQQLSASVQVIPLLSGAIAVDGIVIEKAHFHLEKSAQGRGNWELPSEAEQQQIATNTQAPAAPTSANQAPAKIQSSSALNLAIDNIELRQISADYINREKDQTLSLQQLNMMITQFNLSEQPFAISLDWETKIDDKTSNSQLQNSGELNTEMTLSEDFQRYTFADTNLSTELSGQAADNTIERVAFSANDFNLNNNAFPLTLEWQLSLTNPNISSQGQLNGQLRIPSAVNSIHISDAQLQSTLKGHSQSSEQQLSLSLDLTLPAKDDDATQASGSVKVAPFDLKQLLQVLGQQAPTTSDSKALTDIAFSSQYQSDLNNLQLQELVLQLDDTLVQGQIDIQEFDSATALPKVIAKLHGDKINVDRYLAPDDVAAKTTPPTATPKTAAANPSPTPKSTATKTQSSPEVIIPVADLQPLRLDIGIDFDQMQLKKMRFDAAKVKITADKGLLKLKQLDAQFYQGDIKMTAQVDARPGTHDKATLKSQGALSNIQLAPLLKDLELDQDYQLSGLLSTTFNGNSRGVTDTQIMQLLIGKADINSPQLTLKPINFEEKFCTLVQASKMEGAKAEWPKATVISNFNGSANIKNQLLQIPAIDAEVVNLKLGAYGDVNLDSGEFEILFPLTLTKAWTSDVGCRTKDKFLIDRKMELLRAKGNLNDENPTDSIGQNPKGVRDLASAALQYNLERSLSKKLGLTTKKSDSTEDSSEGKESKEVDSRDAIRGLFDSYIQKKLKEQEEKNK